VRALVLVVLAGIFVSGALVHAARVNVDWQRHDQASYIVYAKSIHDSHGEALGNRLQMPAVPALLSLFFRDDEAPEAFFARAKTVCIAVAALCAALSALLVRRGLPSAPAAAIGLVSVFFVFAFRAAYVQAEPLTYFAAFVLFLVFLRAWRRPSWPLAIAIGVLLAGAFMVKATALVGFYVFALCVAVRAAVRLVRRASLREAIPVAQLAASFGIFAALISPYARNSKRHFGHYLYNLGSTHVMWCDSWEDFLSKVSLPPEQLPTFDTYWRSHTIGQMVVREARGLGEMLGNCFISHGYALFAVVYVGIFVAMVCKYPEVRRRIFRRDADAAAWFVVPYLVAHLLLLGWYGPIAAGNRLILVLFLPGMYALAAALSAHAKPEHTLRAHDWTKLNVAIVLLAVLHLVFYFPYAIATHYSGG